MPSPVIFLVVHATGIPLTHTLGEPVRINLGHQAAPVTRWTVSGPRKPTASTRSTNPPLRQLSRTVDPDPAPARLRGQGDLPPGPAAIRTRRACPSRQRDRTFDGEVPSSYSRSWRPVEHRTATTKAHRTQQPLCAASPPSQLPPAIETSPLSRPTVR